MATPTRIDTAPTQHGDPPQHAYVELSEEQATQGFKTGHMRWVLLIGFALAGVMLGLTALLS